ncbi:hypothetical protein PbJCM13498_27220 [Prolixibacter bellariivorans]|uniref:Uncharacterized protein n=1 Tax=Prolixibacter bellariivorans TaxID=314319 RepID=A0A5M4B117_9BACT|nr:hypothetical protein [Prolixibacter bellariivorans]GET33859.1 hypothetical protein PbJCM13498_27220 [Prolixibacter bellariivorans]
MKNRAILLIVGLIISSSLAFGQVSKDTVRRDSVYPFRGYFSTEQSWQITKEAYRKQLEAEGLSADKVNQKIQKFEEMKSALIEKIKKQQKLAEKQRQLAEIQRQKAEEQRKEAVAQRQEAEKQRQMSARQREQARVEREKASEQRKLAEIQRQKAGEQRKEAAAQRLKAEAQRKMAEEWRKNVKSLLDENVTLSGKDSKAKSVKLEVAQRNPLFFNVDGEINSGNVLIEIFNPKGQKEGELSLEHHRESGSKTNSGLSDNTSGSLNKIINSPETGDWVVTITPEKSTGHIHISIAQYIKPAIDE